MKPFSEMTQEEINSMTTEEFLSVSPFEKKSCADCAHCKASMSLWCRNAEAIAYRGTSIPGVIKCKFWKPNWRYIDRKYRTPENGYVKPTFIQKIISYFTNY
jgi:hypothetical protein